jgi:hypothetical protein
MRLHRGRRLHLRLARQGQLLEQMLLLDGGG